MASNEKIQMLYDMTQRYKEAAEQETDLDKMEEYYKKAIEIYSERVAYQKKFGTQVMIRFILGLGTIIAGVGFMKVLVRLLLEFLL